MLMTTEVSTTFPSVRIPSHCGGLPVEVTLIAQLTPGQGDPLIADAERRQRGHPSFVDGHDEPSTRIGAMNLARGDPSSLYTFSVGRGGHPFHRHAGNRVFTAISGSAGAQLRFSTASQMQIDAEPAAFLHALHLVDIPPDCLFTVRFGGGTWHQFVSPRPDLPHPALFALSCHPDERAGNLPEDLHQRVLDNAADIPALTELLPASVQLLLDAALRDPQRIPTTALSLHAAPASFAARTCAVVRAWTGRLRRRIPGRHAGGFRTENAGRRRIHNLRLPADSLLAAQLPGAAHEDAVAIRLAPGECAGSDAATLMALLLDGFVESPPSGVSRLMALRNVLVRPFGLRTSPLGCPASSLLSQDAPQRFAGRFPVLARRVSAEGKCVEVILGADDRHLAFRTCVRVEAMTDGGMRCAMATRVRTRNLFGRLYMAAIRRVHMRYVAPVMLQLAVDHAVRSLRGEHALRNAGWCASDVLPAAVAGR
ncbi:DUF2867 domain-containing protein [Luteimonas sp. BDR2-5]|uniref:DUF2867 domain-containing protein n=1 Tax=Proluteimonas luteida TaxID=2878685 RepID=UPI001E2ACF30|nr:DUF2867 domain-containing protein [Luteimonas sp. BDR2-5]MCD9028425.1 DUF2867 domain-containing protein [Luteimonas sp. BDR2-5]